MNRFSPPKMLIMTVVTALLAGCAAVSELAPPPQMRQAESVEAERSLKTDTPTPWPQEDWWSAYHDPQLSALIEEGLSSSPDIEAAAARFRRAAGIAQQAGADLYPTLDVAGEAILAKQSYVNGFPKDFVPKGWLDRGLVAAEASLDLDLWGRNRAALAAARSDTVAAALGERQARLTLVTGIADAYSELSNLYYRRDVLNRMLDTRSQTRRLVSDRVANGIDTRGDLRLAEANEASSRTELASLDEQIALRRNQLAALIGEGPDRGLEIERPALPMGQLQGVPKNATTGLLARRVDIAVSLARVEAAGARIDQARAEFYPAIRIDALVGLQALGLDQLIGSDAVYGNVGPAISLPIFDGGRRAGNFRVRRAEYDEAVAHYNSNVLAAYREVADAVTSRRALVERLSNARSAVVAAEDAFRIARLRYRGGLSNYLDLLPVETRMLEAQMDLADLETRAFALDVALVRALGGGFRNGAADESADVGKDK